MDSVTAVVTSVNAVLRNKPAMAVWAACVSALLHGPRPRRGFAWLMLALGVTLPLIGHATWHGYRETIDAEAWPKQMLGMVRIGKQTTCPGPRLFASRAIWPHVEPDLRLPSPG